MKYKTSVIILIIITIFLFSMSYTCAGDMNDTSLANEYNTQIESTQDTNLKAHENNELQINNPKTFTELNTDIKESDSKIEIEHDYKFNNETDESYVLIEKSNFIINGNNHIIDGNKQAGIFNITGNNVTIKNLVFQNGKSAIGGIVDSIGEVTLDNVTFILNNVTFLNTHLKYLGGAVANHGGIINCYNSHFIDNHAETGSSIFIEHGTLNIQDTYITSTISNQYGQIWGKYSNITINNVDFVNISASYCAALSLDSCENVTITNSRFINLTASISAGAIAIKKKGNTYIKDCKFINTKSLKNAGAVNIDYIYDKSTVTILDTIFDNASSNIGGAYIQLGGNLLLANSNFTNNNATYYGGAVYISFVDAIINNCIFDSNNIKLLDDYLTLGSAIFCDYSNLNITDSKFIDNSAEIGNAIYLFDTWYTISKSTFINNINAIYTNFDYGPCNLDNNTNEYNTDSVFINEPYEYCTVIDSPALKLNLTNNTITTSSIPNKFDLRDWGWISPVKNQGNMGSCWTFGMMSALESAILKAYGIEFDLSEDNLYHNMLMYFPYGCYIMNEGGYASISASYLASWFGPVLEEEDIYDAVGKLSPFLTSGYDVVHIQDIIYVPNDENSLKSAILKYGALEITYHADTGNEGYYNYKTDSQYTYKYDPPNHAVAVIGWDDNYSRENFAVKPERDGAWLIKNNWGTEWGDEGYFYLSYCDKSFLNRTNPILDCAIGIIIENTVPYNKNYEHDYTWLDSFMSTNGSTKFYNQFISYDDDLIAAVGTYFNSSDINYTVEIYVNDELKLTQEGISPYLGFHTIKLNEYIPIKEGDVFKAMITSNTMPFTAYSRVYHAENQSYYYDNGEWIDLSHENIAACLKVYTLNDTSKIINNKNITVDYNSGEYFSVKVVTDDGHNIVGTSVKFTINEKTTTVLTDDKGIAKLPITNVPGVYVITTTYNNQTLENNLTVKLNLNNCKVTNNKDITVDYNGGSYFTVKVVSDDEKVAASGVSVIFTINGKSTPAITDENGIARIKITDIPNKYTIVTTFNGKTYSNTVTVKHVLKASKVKVKKTAKKFYLKAKLKINDKKIKGEVIKFKFKGKTYNVKTNKKGIAKVKINKKIIKKLKKGKKYTVKVTYLKDTIKTTVKVK